MPLPQSSEHAPDEGHVRAQSPLEQPIVHGALVHVPEHPPLLQSQLGAHVRGDRASRLLPRGSGMAGPVGVEPPSAAAFGGSTELLDPPQAANANKSDVVVTVRIAVSMVLTSVGGKRRARGAGDPVAAA